MNKTSPFQLISLLLGRYQTNLVYKNNWKRLHLDVFLLLVTLTLCGIGIIILASAVQNNNMLIKQGIRLLIAFGALFVFAQIPPHKYKALSPWAYAIGILLLIGVLLMGKIGKGAQRWLDLGFFRFQPSEIMKLALPMMLAWYIGKQPLPPNKKTLFIATILILVPGFLIIQQPDLGTALMVILAGGSVLLFAGMSWQMLFTIAMSCAISAPILWHFLHDYQRQRVLTFLNPERDPLGAGYHIIQSKIAIGSGGFFGKGWFNGSQAQLNFLPEHATDFIFAVAGEEFGLIGCSIVMIVYLIIVSRIFYMASQAQDSFGRLLISSLGLIFFLHTIVNMGMVVGLLPVVGLPLPLISYGGTSMVTIMASFGMIMSIYTHRKFLPS